VAQGCDRNRPTTSPHDPRQRRREICIALPEAIEDERTDAVIAIVTRTLGRRAEKVKVVGQDGQLPTKGHIRRILSSRYAK